MLPKIHRHRRPTQLFACSLILLLFTSLQSAAERNYNISIAGYNFDPTTAANVTPDSLKLSKEELTAFRKTSNHYLIQLHRTIDPNLHKRLRGQYGLRLEEYIPELTYLERLEPAILKRLSQDVAVRAIVPFEPAFKISPHIGKLEPRTQERKALAESGLLLIATLFNEFDGDSVREALVEAGASKIEVSDLRKYGSTIRIQFILPSRQALDSIAKIKGVRWIEEVPEYDEDNGNTAGTMQSGVPGTTPVWDVGIHGEGQTIGVMEGRSVDASHCMFSDPGTPPGLSHRKIQANFPVTGSHATFVSGIAVGDDLNNPGTGANRGNAWAARLVNTAAGSSMDMLAQLNSSATNGAIIHTNSWHANLGIPTPYDLIASDVDYFIWKNEDHVVLGSMGNNGEEQGPPGTAKNAIGINAGTTFPNIMNIGDGNPGPTAGGRRKPDVVTPGCNIQSARSGTACTISQWGTCATSWATPAAAAAAALIRQYYVDGYYPSGAASPVNAFTPSGALIKATLINGTIDMTDIAGYPSDMEGWGLVRLDNSLFFQGDNHQLYAWDTRNRNGLTTGGSRTHLVDVQSSARPLRVTLTWSDAPAADGADNPAVNDLNLRVISPDGTQTYLGNVFAGGVSTTGGAADSLNNVEQAVITSPAVGKWRIIVSAASVNVGKPGQGYALVATSDRKKEPKVAYKYAAKIICGVQDDPDNMRLAKGFYATAINIHNPNRSKVSFTKKLSLTFPPDAQRPGKVYPISRDKLRPDEALEVDCIDVRRKLFPAGFPKPYIKGFVVLEADKRLSVSAVYTARGLDTKSGCCTKSCKQDCCNSAESDAHCHGSKKCCKKPAHRHCCETKGGQVNSIDVEQIEPTVIKVGRVPPPEVRLPDLVPVAPFPQISGPQLPQNFCMKPKDGFPPADRIRVIVRNQGPGPAAPSDTSVEFITPGFGPAGTLTQDTPALEPSGEPGDQAVLEFDIPRGCYTGGGAGCSFRISVDSAQPDEVSESDEDNNIVLSGCPGVAP